MQKAQQPLGSVGGDGEGTWWIRLTRLTELAGGNVETEVGLFSNGQVGMPLLGPRAEGCESTK